MFMSRGIQSVIGFPASAGRRRRRSRAGRLLELRMMLCVHVVVKESPAAFFSLFARVPPIASL